MNQWLKAGASLAFLIVCAALAIGLAGCEESTAYTGTVAETRGKCWTFIADGTRYAVSREDGTRLGLKAGAKVTIRGDVAVKQDCAAAVKIEVAQ